MFKLNENKYYLYILMANRHYVLTKSLNANFFIRMIFIQQSFLQSHELLNPVQMEVCHRKTSKSSVFRNKLFRFWQKEEIIVPISLFECRRAQRHSSEFVCHYCTMLNNHKRKRKIKYPIPCTF